MRILYAALGYKPAYKIGGPVVSVSSTAECLVKKGHEVVVFTSNSNLTEDLDVPTDQPVDVNGVQVWYFKREEYIKRLFSYIPYLSQSVGFLYSPKMRGELERIMPSFDLVHTQCPFVYPTYACANAAFRFGKPLFYQQRGLFGTNHLKRRALKKRLYILLVEGRILHRATTLIALTKEELHAYKALGFDAPCKIVPNGVDVTRYRQHPESSADEKLGIPAGARVILFMGRLNSTKGADILVEAFIDTQKRHPDTVLVIAGPDESNIAESLRSTAIRAGIGPKVLFPGMITGDTKLDLLARADLFCSPSHAEGFSMAILEALASATPVLITPSCNFPEVEAAGAGKVVAEDSKSLAQSLCEMLDMGDSLRTMGDAARNFVARDYTWDCITDQLLEVYEEGIQRHHRIAQTSPLG
ncbi:MAG: glycosyltransferase [Armatimonadetes bacterium]|nr:glycosyltransferase [Armatimonadota bacterium]